MKEYNIEELLNEIDFNKNKYVKINDKLMLTNYQISVLKRFNLKLEEAPSLSYIIFEAENILEEEPDEELEQVLNELSERNYYENTNK